MCKRASWVATLGVAGTIASAAWGAGFAPAADRSPTTLEERRLMQSLFDLRQGRIQEALRNVSFLVREQPDFRLAQLLYADLLSAHAQILSGPGNGKAGGRVTEHLDEARARLQRYLESPPPDAVPAELLRLPAGTPAAIVIDLEGYRLFLFEQRDHRFVRTRDFYVSIGKGGSDKRREGDEKTPVGVYLVNDYLPEKELPDLYGVGAFPINYPNAWDRLQGRTGSGIWIHGTEFTSYSRPPLSSRGCVTLSNRDFELLERHVRVDRTPVIVARTIDWVRQDEHGVARRNLEQALETWRRDWESRDPDRYLSHYSREFRTPGMSRTAFANHKRRVNSSKRYIRVELAEVGMYRYPGESDLVLVDFVQRYESDNFRAQRRKHQYWRQEGGRWRIFYEEGL